MEGIRAPSQQRGQEALDRLLKAGAELVAERGCTGFTLSEVSKRAGVSYGAMYWRVESKEALLAAVHQRFLDEAEAFYTEALAQEKWMGSSAVETLDGALRTIAGMYDGNLPLIRAIALYAGQDEETAKRATLSIQGMGKLFCALLIPKLEEASHPTPAETTNLIYTIAIAAVGGHVTWPEFRAEKDVDWNTFVDGVCAMAIRLLDGQLTSDSS